MLLEDEYNADDILRDKDSDFDTESDYNKGDYVRELNLGNEHDAKKNFRELASDIGDEEDLWG